MTSLTSPKFKGALKAQQIQFSPSSEEILGKASGFRAKLHQPFAAGQSDPEKYAGGHRDPRSHSPCASRLRRRSELTLPFGPPTRPHGPRAQSPRAYHHVPVRNREKGQEAAAGASGSAAPYPRPAEAGAGARGAHEIPNCSRNADAQCEPCAPSVLQPLPKPTRLPAKRRATPRRAPHRTCPLRPARRPPAAPWPAPLTCRAARRSARSAAVAASRLPSSLASGKPDQLFRSRPAAAPSPAAARRPGLSSPAFLAAPRSAPRAPPLRPRSRAAPASWLRPRPRGARPALTSPLPPCPAPAEVVRVGERACSWPPLASVAPSSAKTR